MRKRTKFNFQEISNAPIDAEGKRIRKLFPNLRTFVHGEMQVSIGTSQDFGHYFNISKKSGWPTMDEIMFVRSRFIPPDVDMALIIPSDSRVFGLHAHQITRPKFMPVRDKVDKQLGVERVSQAPPD